MVSNLRRRTVLRIKSFTSFALSYGVIGLVWDALVADGSNPLIGAGFGVVIGITLAVFEESRVSTITRTMSLTSAVIVKSLLYWAVLLVSMLVFGFLGGLLQGLALEDFRAWVFSAELPIQLLIIFGIHLTVVFVRHVNRLLGPNTLMRYLSGKYHRPTVEKRIFMFLDLKGSTMLAETLGGEQYFSLLNTFFRDISEPILERSAEIYQYIGDEVVLTWPVETGLHDANCIRVFVEILAEIHSRRNHYQTKFGHVPEFKAGLHFGEVITAEIGDLKKEIVYNGDVLNTTARIQSMCNEFDRQLIASEELVSAVTLPEFIQPVALGKVVLRGKAEPTALVALA